METRDYLDQNQGFQHDYDDENDSDVEARLYAEVYHSNTIIGEEYNTNNSTIAIGVLDNSKKTNSSNYDLLHDKNPNPQNSDGTGVRDSVIAPQNSSIGNDIISTESATRRSNSQKTNNFPQKSESLQRVSDLNNTPNFKKRISNGCLDEVNNLSKKKKYENKSDAKESQSSQFKKPLSKSHVNQQRDNVQNNYCSLVNPYNKNVIDSRQNNMKLLSPEFMNLIFSGNTRKKKKKDYPVQKDKNKKPSTFTDDITISSSNTRLAKNSCDGGSTNDSAVIDISSESSNESFEDYSKYNTIMATDKKLNRRDPGLKITRACDSSDSEESIFEVPVPPKPAPPLIEVKDSDNEREKSNERDQDSFLSDSSNSLETTVQSNHNVSLNSTMDRTQDLCEIVSDSDDSENLILNCTEIQKGVSTLSEIKKMNQQTPSKNAKISNVSNSFQQSQQIPESSSNSVTIGKSSTGSKTKQKSLSSRNISAGEYFFRPMTEKMTSFYNNSWGGEHFDIDEIKNNMSRDPNKWAILNRDLVLTGPKKRRYFGMTCARCHKDGHRQNDCPKPNKGPTCHMCGANGHPATYCPRTQCLTCGARQVMYRTSCAYCEKLFCTRCRSQGHKDDSCPDLWRRYHHTTNSVAPNIPLNVKSIMKSRYEVFCCNCTKQGHESVACKKLRWSQHFPNPPFVTHYNGPIYNDVTDFGASSTSDDVQELPCNVYNTYNNSSKCDDSYSNSATSKTVSTNFPRSNRRNENIVQNRSDCSPNVSDPDKNIIFNVFGSTNKFNEETQMKSITLQLSEKNKSNANSVGSWTKLSYLFKSLLSDMPAKFRLERKDKKLFMYIQGSRKYIDSTSALIKQYASRSDFERSQMLLSGERNLKKIVIHLSEKFAELKNLDEDILKLHEKVSQLRKDLDEESLMQNQVQNRLKQNELVLSEQKLSMLLHREGLGDGSLGQLRKLFLKMKKSLEQTIEKKRTEKKKSKFILKPLISFKNLFTYLYYYNNIFVPYESAALKNSIQKYKDNLDMRNKLMNSSLLFPKENGGPERVTVQDSTSNEKATDDSLNSLPSTSQEQPVLQKGVTKASMKITDHKSSSDLPNQVGKLAEPKSRKKLNLIYSEALRAKNPTKQDELMRNFRRFIKNTRTCLEEACNLESPSLRHDIANLQRELEDETCVNTKRVKMFRKKVKKETLRMQSIKKKNLCSKNNVEPSTADIKYKEFCASL